MPDVVDIIQSVQVPQLIKDAYISKGNPVLDGRGRPVHYTGGFAVVFPFLVDGDKWAFRCWSADIGNIEKRLYTLSTELKQLQLPYFCDFSYEPAGIIINGTPYPSTRMQWIDGKTIKDYLCKHKAESEKIKKLANDFKEMCGVLHQHKIAHGDLQHGNILVDNDGNIYLIDYDSVYLPALQGENDFIAGLPDYQHPKRKENKIASEKLDYFSELIIYLSISAVAEDASLIDKYQVEDADRLLFAKEDFADIKNSQVYKDIYTLGKEFQEMLLVLEEYLKCNDINELLPFEQFMLDKKITFVASATKVVRNTQKVTLKWNVLFNADVYIKKKGDDTIHKHGEKGELSMTLMECAVFELSIETTDGRKIKKELAIDVFDECEIEFSSDKKYVFPTIPVKLEWNVKYAKKVWLDKEEVLASGTKVIEPEKATTYVLSAEDEFGIKEKKIDIQMLPLPQVKSLLVPTPNITSNLSVHIKQPKYQVDVRFPTINIDWINVEIPKVPSLIDLELKVELALPIKEISIWESIKKVYNQIKQKRHGK